MKEFIDTKEIDNRLLGEVDLKEEKTPNISDAFEEIETDEPSNISNIEDKIREERLSPFININEVFDGGQILYNWKRYKRMTAKIINIQTNYVELECLVDEDNVIYKPKIIEKHLLEEVTLVEGNYLLFNYYKKGNEWKIEILDDQRLFLKNEFPKVDFDKFENSEFFKED